MLQAIAMMAFLGTVGVDFEINATRISVMRVLTQERENLFGEILEEKTIDAGVFVKNGESYIYITTEKTMQIKLPGEDGIVRVRETTIIDRKKTIILTQLTERHDRVKRLRSLIIIKDKGSHAHVTVNTEVSLKGTKQLWANMRDRIKNRRVEEMLRLHLE